MTNNLIKIVLILLLVFSPIAFGSQLLWAFSLMELGILLIIILAAIQVISNQLSVTRSSVDTDSEIVSPDIRTPNSAIDSSHGSQSEIQNPKSEMVSSSISNPKSEIRNPKSLIPIICLSLFLGLVLFQMIPLPAGLIKIISPKTYELRTQLAVISSVTKSEIPPGRRPLRAGGRSPQSAMGSSEIQNDSMGLELKSAIRNPKSEMPLSLFPFMTKIEFFKWLALTGLFIFLLRWKISDNRYRITSHLIIAIFLVGVFESLYGIFEFFSGHRHILNLDWSSHISSVTGTFLNRNYFAGYLLMVIPLSIGFLFSREAAQHRRFRGWRNRLSSLDGKTLLIGFGVILMILGLVLSASRMGIVSLLISFSLISILFRNPHGRQRVSRIPILIFGLAVLWAAWIGLDAVISRFFTASEGLESRWMIWVNTFGIFKDFPLLGSGLGTFTEVFSMYRSFHVVGLHTHAENDFLQLASEVGVVGVGLLLVLFLFLFYKAASGIRSLRHGEPQRYIGIGGLVGILALMFHSIVERNIQVPANAFLYTVMWAITLRIALDSGSKRTRYTIEPKNQIDQINALNHLNDPNDHNVLNDTNDLNDINDTNDLNHLNVLKTPRSRD